MAMHFVGFRLDPPRAELRGPDGVAVKLRPKTLGLLILFATNPGRILSKQELMDAIWPNVHVGDDSLFQCIREIRSAWGDARRQVIRLVSGHGYVFEADVSTEATPAETPAALPFVISLIEPGATPDMTPERRLFGLRRRVAGSLAALTVVVAI